MKLTRARWLMLAAAVAGVAVLALDIARAPAPAKRSANNELSDLVVAPARAASARVAPAATPALDASVIARRAAEAAAAADAFATRSWVRPPPPAPPPPPPVVEPPPPPQAPPLPFKYVGRLEESAERTVWYLSHGERLLLVVVGDTIEATWRLDSAEAGQLRWTYLPLDIKQAMPIGAVK